jgi:hypothetical protein
MEHTDFSGLCDRGHEGRPYFVRARRRGGVSCAPFSKLPQIKQLLNFRSTISARFSDRQAKSLRMHPAVRLKLMSVDSKTSNGQEATTSERSIEQVFLGGVSCPYAGVNCDWKEERGRETGFESLELENRAATALSR